MADGNRAIARDLAHQYVSNGDPLGWFEALYDAAQGDSAIIPWADLSPNPNLLEWLQREPVDSRGLTAMKVGCGLGDDAEELSRRGYDTTAFDISASAIEWCHRRFPASSVRYVEADLLQMPEGWIGRFDFVVESYTLQVLPPHLRQEALARVASLVAPGGTLLLIARGRERSDDEGQMPWPLTRHELAALTDAGLVELAFEDYVDDEDPPVRRFRGTYQRFQLSAAHTQTR